MMERTSATATESAERTVRALIPTKSDRQQPRRICLGERYGRYIPATMGGGMPPPPPPRPGRPTEDGAVEGALPVGVRER